MLLRRAVSSIGAGHSAPEAAGYAIDLLWQRIQDVGGLILLDRQGQIGIAHSSPNVAFAWMREGMDESVAGVKV
jgi:beta-aspartyl-peptidase (threonine type)